MIAPVNVSHSATAPGAGTGQGLSQTMLAVSQICQGLSAEEVEMVAARVRAIRVAAGAVIFRQHDAGANMFIVLSGRLKVTAPERTGQRVLGYLAPGDHVGEMALLTGASRTATVTAVMDCELAELKAEPFEDLMNRIPRLAANLSRTLGFRLRAANMPQKLHAGPSTVGIVHNGRRSAWLAPLLAELLAERGEAVALLAERGDGSPRRLSSGAAYRLDESQTRGDAANLTARLATAAGRKERALVDLSQHLSPAELARACAQCEEIFWVIEPADADAALARWRDLRGASPLLAERTRIVWALSAEDRVAPPMPSYTGLPPASFKVPLDERPERGGWPQRQGLIRLARHLARLRVGLALSGGGARGMAHLGVLRALDKAGIVIDVMAGTSCGAMVGMSYAGGYTPDEAVGNFMAELTPPRWVRELPGGNHFYLWSMFRRLCWEGKLRRYLKNWSFDQLRLPFRTVTADLVSGQQVIRGSGDSVHAVLESINLPVVSAPIYRNGMALVDGGILNNLPADLLTQDGADLVIGVDVVSRIGMATHFRREQRPRRWWRPGRVETSFRVNEMQDRELSALRMDLIDVLITPETSGFGFTDFYRADELADTGEQAAQAAMPRLKRLLAELEAPGRENGRA